MRRRRTPRRLARRPPPRLHQPLRPAPRRRRPRPRRPLQPPRRPLHQGRIITDDNADTCVVCPWHGSTFRVADGSVVHGPATARQPTFETRVTEEGVLQVKPV
ncbi:Rieske (2Fe-2S) protein [Actinomadura madurae]|uniref:Rieske (2Fe-2S) protein n=1 Tax=Actinomadura madurae TaxID=1993 RepID=UPI0020D20622|nr:Rieske (2Fe-2S) protein [Actinomadura madurae]MCP9952394.1 Rieske (2Fe-2S) protein [Actinomadura madurae]MCP9969158.1 Rieske (2Fe-2S) protein [Actinomadura madurae]MCQ0017833.1 Rieske (2Fe-2S) protein [Actinomadura madurae]